MNKLIRKVTSALFLCGIMVLTGCGAAYVTSAVAYNPTAESNQVNNDYIIVNEPVETVIDIVPTQNPSSPVNTVPADTSNGRTLTIAAAIEYGGALKDAARKFEAKNPGVTVVIDAFTDYATRKSRDSDMPRYSEYVKSAINSGTADIVSASFGSWYMPWREWADANLLADINEYITFPEGEYYLNVLDAYLYNGKRYTLPLSFSFPVKYLDKSVMSAENISELTVEGLIQLKAKYPDRNLFLSAGMLFSIGEASITGGESKPVDLNYVELISTASESFIDFNNKRAEINNERFISILESVKALNDGSNVNAEGSIFTDEEQYTNIVYGFDQPDAADLKKIVYRLAPV